MKETRNKRKMLRFDSREQWLEARKEGIGASEVASVIGVNPWETPYQLWLRKTGRAPELRQNAAMRAGHILEDAVARYFSEDSGREIIKRSAVDFMYVDEEKPFLRVSPDRMYWLGDGRSDADKGILECKTTQSSIDPDDLPRNYFCQVQMLMYVSRYDHASLAWLERGINFGYKDIEAVPEFQEWLAHEVEQFWRVNVLGDVEPDALDAGDVMLKYPTHEAGKSVEVGSELLEDYRRLKGVREEIERLGETKERLEERLKMAFGDAEALTFKGETLATWKAPKPSKRFDLEGFRLAHPTMADAYMKTQQGSRRFLLK